MVNNRKLPIGIQDFEGLRTENLVMKDFLPATSMYMFICIIFVNKI
jgi:hypothetical protein